MTRTKELAAIKDDARERLCARLLELHLGARRGPAVGGTERRTCQQCETFAREFVNDLVGAIAHEHDAAELAAGAARTAARKRRVS